MRKRNGFGWLELIEGILLIILGIYTFTRPEEMLTGVVMVYGLVALFTGIADIIFYIKMEKHIGFGVTISLISGLCSILPAVVYLPLHFQTFPFECSTFGGRKFLLLFYPDRKCAGIDPGCIDAP